MGSQQSGCRLRFRRALPPPPSQLSLQLCVPHGRALQEEETPQPASQPLRLFLQWKQEVAIS